VRDRLLGLEPDFTIERFLATTALERQTDRELFAEGLRLAGIAERDPTTVAAENDAPVC
jgi:hypothetical protein